MANLFELKERELLGGVLANNDFHEGCYGSITVYKFGGLLITGTEPELAPGSEPPEGARIHFKIADGLKWAGLFEPPDYVYNYLQPYDRRGTGCYMPYAFDKLDEIETSDNGRFLSLKMPAIMSGPTATSLAYYPGWRLAVVRPLRELEGLSNDLRTMLKQSGVPEADVRNLQEEIFGKFGFDKGRIMP